MKKACTKTSAVKMGIVKVQTYNNKISNKSQLRTVDIFNMLNSTDNKNAVPLQRLPILATFEILIVVIAVLIIVTSSSIVKNIYEKMNRTRADFMFTLLSISDIGVGVLSMAALGIFGPFSGSLYYYYYQGSRLPLIITLFCYDFPYIFSNILTTIISVDRLFICTTQNSYKYIITEKKLIITVALLFAISIGYCCVTTYYSLPEKCCDINEILREVFCGVILVSMIVVTLVYIRILCIVRKCLKAMLPCKHGNCKSERRLFTTIFHILICQVACVVPYLILFSLQIFKISLPYNIIGPWLVILRNTQCFCNGFILLRNQKGNGRKNETFPLEEKLNENRNCKTVLFLLTTLHGPGVISRKQIGNEKF